MKLSKWISRGAVLTSLVTLAITAGCGGDDEEGSGGTAGSSSGAGGKAGANGQAGSGAKAGSNAQAGTAMGGTGGTAGGVGGTAGSGGNQVGGQGGSESVDGGSGGEAMGGAGNDVPLGGAGGEGGGGQGGQGGQGGSNDPATNTTVKINEVRSDGGTDFVELYNSGAAIDIGGWHFRDSDPAHVYTFPANTVLAQNAFLALQDDASGFDFGLGSNDSVVLYDAADNIVDSYDWTAHVNTASRCPNGTGAFITGRPQTQGLANDCP
jgi:hypothetical protein